MIVPQYTIYELKNGKKYQCLKKCLEDYTFWMKDYTLYHKKKYEDTYLWEEAAFLFNGLPINGLRFVEIVEPKTFVWYRHFFINSALENPTLQCKETYKPWEEWNTMDTRVCLGTEIVKQIRWDVEKQRVIE